VVGAGLGGRAWALGQVFVGFLLAVVVEKTLSAE
jgi:hypothetical protein